MRKTAMQQHIDHLKICKNLANSYDDSEVRSAVIQTLEAAIENAEFHVNEEKKQLHKTWTDRSINIENMSFKDYFNKTYE